MEFAKLRYTKGKVLVAEAVRAKPLCFIRLTEVK
jgi:hypothetical protein